MSSTRTERDSMGEVTLPADALYGAQTQRAINNFALSGRPLPARFIQSLALVKEIAARTNLALGIQQPAVAEAIIQAASSIQAGEHADQFPVDLFQTGSGTSSNMNMNEVLANLAKQASGVEVHPNDDVNLCQSSNDVIPTTLHVSAALAIYQELLPALERLEAEIANKADSTHQVKTGRTHLMDAMPVTFAQELSGWQDQVAQHRASLENLSPRLLKLAQGGTAVGTGVNAHEDFGATFARLLAEKTGLEFAPADNYFSALASVDAAVAVSGQLRAIGLALIKIANDLRWMNSGPLSGLAEIELEALQPGSSIMPGKVNPVIPEAVTMAGAQVVGHDAAIAMAGQSGNFHLNVMLPMVAANLLASIDLLTASCDHLAEKAIRSFKINQDNIERNLARNPILATALNPVIGYNKAAEIAKQAYAEQRPVLEVALELTDLSREELETLLDPARLVRGGLEP